MKQPTDEQILERAKEIQGETGLSLMDAMQKAQDELTPAPVIPSDFTITIKAKPRVAAWVVEQFGGHPTLSIEDRLGAYMSEYLPRLRIEAKRMQEDAPDIGEGEAVTMSRTQFLRKAKQ